MLKLPTITFVIVENRWPERVARLCSHIRAHVSGAQIAVWDRLPWAADKSHYDRFCSLSLHEAFTTPHALLCQLDGYPVHWDSWTDEFLEYDYVGSLRSRRLHEELAGMEWRSMPDDVFICQHARPRLEARGIRFAPAGLAARFSVEHRCPEHEAVPAPFGFHDARLNPHPSF
ncbi:hypothetical protein EBZ39_08770 [bacterium]|nr:hypothetical protein [bacterium]